MKKYNRGFTLIELLVVIAIIGILASVVLVSLNSARKKGNDTRVISDVNQIRTALETGYNGTSYPDLAANALSASGPNAANLTSLSTDLSSQGGTLKVVTNASSPFVQYSISSPLVSNTASYFCVDSTGKAETTSTAPSAVTCP